MSVEKLIDRHLCFVSANAYPLFTDDEAKSIGGVETRSVRLAEMMSDCFTKISFAIRNTEGKVVNDRGLNIVRYEPAVISNSPNPDLVKINADIYIVFESHYFTADVVRSCNIIGKPVVHWATSYIDYDKACTLDNFDYFYYDWIGRESAYCFYLANYLISQTEDQQKMLFNNHGLKSFVIRNPFLIPEYLPERIQNKVSSPTILWIGRTEPVFKRPELLLKIAKQLPEYLFLMILNNTNNGFFKKIVESKTPNVEIIEYVVPDEIERIYDNCSILLSTSSNEGFPNIFLHAISHGIPIVSLDIDPDGMFSEHGCGLNCNGDIGLAVHSIKRLLNDKQIREEIAQRAFSYARKNHSLELIQKQMVNFFSSIPLCVNNRHKWTEYKFDRINEQLQSEYDQIKTIYQKLQINHNSLLNNRIIRILNIFRKTIGKKQWN
jgi:glycosyltransferase involved in cell wall biosynthesis